MLRTPHPSGSQTFFAPTILGASLAIASLALASCSGEPGAARPDPLEAGGYPGSGAAPGYGSAPAAAQYTCPVQLFQPCRACHDGRGTAATPMGLLTFEDFHAPSPSNPAWSVYQILPSRLRATVPNPMPPDGMLDAASLAAIDSWVAAGGPDCGFAHAGQPPGQGGAPPVNYGGAPPVNYGGAPPVNYGGAPPVGAGGAPPVNYGGAPPVNYGGAPPVGAGGAGGPPPFDVTPYLSPDGTYFIKEPPGDLPVGPDAPGADFCFNVVAHGGQQPLPQDATAYQVKASEYYHEFYYRVPYTKPMWALSTKPIIDNNRVLHHWLLFKSGSNPADGSHADEIGLQIGNSMITGWAPGGNPLDMPPSVGLEMPAPGGTLAMETHYNNVTGAGAPDRSGVRICMTSQQPANVATLTWLGTEIINIPAQAQGTSSGTCTSWRGNTDVHVIQAVPHMHKLGAHMKTVINRKGGGQEAIVDKAFAFADQRSYPVDVVVHAGDTLTTTCTFQNNTSQAVGFGTSTAAEMCYNFVIAYPAHALDGIGGIEGSSNMCLF